jgi:ribosomal protein S18 acetylase RimI-like enzyme
VSVVPDRESEPLFELRAATDSDDDFLLGLFAATHVGGLKGRQLPADVFDRVLRLQFRAQRQSYFARFPTSVPQIVVFQGVPAGLWWIAESDEEYRILDIAIAPDFRNRKIGTLLVTRLLATADSSGKPVKSSVAKTNGGSIRFHQRLGFEALTGDEIYLQMEYRPASRLKLKA